MPIKKPKLVYVCQKCGAQSPKWLGRCTECSEWGSVIEETIAPPPARGQPTLGGVRPQSINQIKTTSEPRLSTGIGEMDRILGGGLVQGSVVLIGGSPGIGKSTLVLQIASKLAQTGKRLLYVSAEESPLQTKIRAERLNVNSDNLLLVSETNLDMVGAYIEELNPSFVVIDSIQMVYKPQIPSSPGTLTQLRECAMELVYLAKRKGISLFLIGHVTKEGAIAGPRSLEHIVDTVLYFEGDRFQSFRILRAVKNRFGSTNEIGIFEMKQEGLVEVENPSRMFMSQSSDKKSAGSVIISSLIGTRTLLIEVQALTSRSNYAVPSRRVSGVDFNRSLMILAVLERRVGLAFGGQDIFVNAVGGVKVDEPAADLGIALAVASSLKNKPIPADTIAVGEIGLGGEVRGVSQINNRVQEAHRLGFNKIIIPSDNLRGLSKPAGLQIIKTSSLRDTIGIML